MAQELYTDDIQPNYDAGEDIFFNDTAVIHEKDSEPIGVGNNTPWVGLFTRVRGNRGNTAFDPGDYGVLETKAVYFGGTETRLTYDEDPFSEVNSLASHTETSFAVHADGKLRPARWPSSGTGTSVAQGGTNAARQRLAVDPSRTLIAIKFLWTPIA